MARRPPLGVRSRQWLGPSVGRASRRDDTQQREMTPTNGERFRWSAPVRGAATSALLGLPEDLVNLGDVVDELLAGFRVG